jgi:hypothetical protein
MNHSDPNIHSPPERELWVWGGTDKLTHRLGLALPGITHVALYVADSAHSNTVLSLSVAPNTHFPARKKLTCQYFTAE